MTELQGRYRVGWGSLLLCFPMDLTLISDDVLGTNVSLKSVWSFFQKSYVFVLFLQL